MLTRIGLNNFKAFREMPPLELKPITVLAGANSSGKSSIIQALLLLKQTLAGRRNHFLALNGEFLNFSRYSELVFGQREAEMVTINLELVDSVLSDSLTQERLSTFFSPAIVGTILSAEPIEKLRARYEITFESLPQQKRVVVHSIIISSVLGGQAQSPFELRLARIGEIYTGKVSLPDPFFGLVPPHNINNFAEGEGVEQESKDEVEWAHFLPQAVTYRVYNEADELELKQVPLDLLAIPNLQAELGERLHYVGPLRSEPQRAYLVLADQDLLDYRGAYTAQLLLQERDEPVDYLIDGQFQEKSLGLLKAVNSTMEMIGLPQSVSPISQAGVVSQLTLPLVGDDSQQVTLVDVGFGVSQVLPIIVAGLRANKGDILIFEQPETHLHPKIQDALADFFILLYRLGKQVIVETHSDHLINGLRLRVVAGPTDTLKDDIQVVFVRPPELKGEGSRVEPLQIDEYGMIISWPPEFMSESMKQMQEILRLGVEKRRRKRRQ